MANFDSPLDVFLVLVYVPAKEGPRKQLLPILKVYKNLLNPILRSDGQEADVNEDDEFFDTNKRLAPILIEAFRVVIMALPPNEDVTERVCDWWKSVVFNFWNFSFTLILTNFNQVCNMFRNIAEKYQFPSAVDSRSFMDLLFSMNYRCRSDLTLLDSLCAQLGHSFTPISSQVIARDIQTQFQNLAIWSG